MAATQRLGVASHDLGGAQGGPLLLFLHANGFHGRAFLPMLPVFTPHFRCVALDMPGHGCAPTPIAPFTAEDMLAAVRDYVGAQGIQDCYCFGHSLGGAMAALLQHERPQTFRAMFLFEPVIRPSLELYLEDMPQPTNGAAGPARGSSAPAVSGRAGAAGRVSRGPGAAASGGGCGPSPSVVAGPKPRSESLLARIARKRQAVYPNVEAAKAALGAKPPFNTFDPQALHAYLGCGGLRPLEPSEPAAAGMATVSSADGGVEGSVEAVSASNAPASFFVTLSCSPENEARVYEALEPPPWRPWQQLTTASEAGRQRCGDGGARGGGSARMSGCKGEAESGPVGRQWRPCRVAIAVGREVGLHARLAQWGAEVAEAVPGARLIRFPSLQHLGPMEDPRAVAEAALQFLLSACDGRDDAPGAGPCLGSGSVADGGGGPNALSKL